MKQPLKRTNFFFPVVLLERLRMASKNTGLPMSELIRQSVDEKLKRMKL